MVANVSVNCCFALNAGVRARLSGYLLPSGAAGAWNLGTIRSTGVGSGEIWEAQEAASASDSREQNLHEGVEVAQQRQQQRMSGGGKVVPGGEVIAGDVPVMAVDAVDGTPTVVVVAAVVSD
jgi:hypothetical protein